MDILYGVDYNIYACGGIGNHKLKLMGNRVLYFYAESEMLREVAKLKEDKSIGEIIPFIAQIAKTKYEI
ncbi:hypothetical protein [Lederbergia lenta]|uniref:hypothetical protein n=1 Tax=Lederbergia lenta TaxID=1467 RepID=UPI00203CB0EC|nr:hypothetical protein [Lederbergia lenta]MCM3109888.1 hypothetical protein [Lederbergia lenta]